MTVIKSQKYECEECGRENDITYNQGSEWIDHVKYETRSCHYCDSKYKLINNQLYFIPNSAKSNFQNSQRVGSAKLKKAVANVDDKVPLITYIILGLIGFGAFCFIMQAISNRSNNLSNIQDSASQNLSNPIYNSPSSFSPSGIFEIIASMIVTGLFLYFAFRLIKKLFN